MKRRDLIRHLVDHGCELIREGANHSWWGNPENGRRSAVPRHKEVSNVLAHKICHDLGIAEPYWVSSVSRITTDYDIRNQTNQTRLLPVGGVAGESSRTWLMIVFHGVAGASKSPYLF